jgi:transcriptional regulator with XRE-family HTH domain
MDKQEDALRVFGRRLSQLREQRGISVAELATRTGLDPRDIADIEVGERDIPITTIFRLAAGLGIAPAQLLAPQP